MYLPALIFRVLSLGLIAAGARQMQHVLYFHRHLYLASVYRSHSIRPARALPWFECTC